MCILIELCTQKMHQGLHFYALILLQIIALQMALLATLNRKTKQVGKTTTSAKVFLFTFSAGAKEISKGPEIKRQLAQTI